MLKPEPWEPGTLISRQLTDYFPGGVNCAEGFRGGGPFRLARISKNICLCVFIKRARRVGLCRPQVTEKWALVFV